MTGRRKTAGGLDFRLDVRIAQLALVLLLAAAGWLNHGVIPQLAWITRARKRTANGDGQAPASEDDRIQDMTQDELAAIIDETNEVSIALARALQERMASAELAGRPGEPQECEAHDAARLRA